MVIRRLGLLLVFFSTALFSFIPFINAQGPEEVLIRKTEEIVVLEEQRPLFEWEAYGRYISPQGVSAQSGSVGVASAETSYIFNFKAFDKLPIGITLGQDYTSLTNSTQIELPTNLVGLSANIEATLPFFNFRNTYFRLGVSPSIYGDSWDFYSSRFRMPSQYMLIYSPNDRLAFIAGVAVFPDYDNNLAPILGVIYRPNKKLLFNIVPMRPTVTYFLNDKASFFTEFAMKSEEYEVNTYNKKNIVLSYDEYRAGVGANYSFTKNIEASLCVGSVFKRSINYRDDPGKVVPRTGFYSEARVDIRT